MGFDILENVELDVQVVSLAELMKVGGNVIKSLRETADRIAKQKSLELQRTNLIDHTGKQT